MIELIKGVALLLSIALLHRYVIQIFQVKTTNQQLACGLLFGGMCIVVMTTPLEIIPGVIFDSRSVVLSMAGLFSGVVGSLVAATIAGTYRAWLGGAGAPVGVGVVIICTFAGLVYRKACSRGLVSLSPLSLLFFGVIVHLMVIGLFTFLPAGVAEKVMDSIAIPLLITFTPGVMLLGLLLSDNEKAVETQTNLKSRTRQALHAENTAQNALAEIQQKQGLIDEHAIFSQSDENGIIVSVNNKFCDVSGYSREELIGQKYHLLNSGEHSKAFFDGMWEIITSGKTWRGEIKNIRKDASAYWVKSTICPIFDKKQHISGYATIETDISEDVQRQQEAVQARNEALEANAAKSRFIATMSHELRTPLNAIIGFADLINSESFGPIQNKKYAEYILDIHKSGEVLRGLIDDILDIARFDFNTYEFSDALFDMADMASEITDRFKVLSEPSGINVVFFASPDFPKEVNADRKALNHILNNLISNALKASSAGDKITVSLCVQDNEFVLSVEDTGRGMTPAMLVRLGEPFVREKDEYLANSDSEGIGLGFYITRSLVEARGGRVEVDSDVGKGTKVRAIYPRKVFEVSPQP